MIDLGLNVDETDEASQETTVDDDGAARSKRVWPTSGFFSQPTASDNLSLTHGGAFHLVLRRYEQEISVMLETTVETVMRKLTAQSRDYTGARELWMQTGPAGVDVSANMELSGAASQLLVTIRNCLFHLSKTLHPKLFSQVWQRVARCLDDFLYEKLVRSNRFTPCGSAQLRFDLRHSFFPLFGAYASQKPDVYFPQCRDACTLLNLPNGSAELLRSTLVEHLSGQKEGRNNPLGPLLELGVYALTAEESVFILNSRTGAAK